ncbi:MAG: ComEA family DNA-binding protein [Rhodothermia bacterium]
MNRLRQFFARIQFPRFRFSRQESMALAVVFGLYVVGLTWRHVQKASVPFDKEFYARIDSVTGRNAMTLVPVGLTVARDTVPKPKKSADSLNSDQASGISDQALVPQSLKGGEESGSGRQMVSGRLNVNRATVRQLTLLPGIGPSLAGRIVEYREVSGPFRSTSDLVKVKGIGPKTLAKFEGMIVVE